MLETTDNRISYTGSGTTGPFSFPYYFLEDNDLTVIKVTISTGAESTLALTTDYTVSGAGDAAGGSVTLVSSLSSAYKLVILRDPDALQSAAYPRNDPFPSATHERVADKLTMLLQRVKELVTRSIRLPDGDTSGATLTVPIVRANKALIFDASGNVTVSTDDYEDQATAAAASASESASSASAASTSASQASTSASNASTSATAAAASAAALPNAVTAGADKVIVTDGAGTGWLYKTAAQMRTFLSLVVGTDVQAYAASASQAEAEAGTEAGIRSFSPLRIAQAIAALVPASSSGRLAPNFANSSTQVAQRATAGTLSTSRVIGQCDNIGVWASGGSVGAGTITQISTAISGTTGYACRAAGVTLTGSGVISHSIRMESLEAKKYKSQTASFSVKVDHDVGSAIDYTLVVKKANSANDFSATTTISTSGATSVSSATATTLTFNGVSMGDCSNGIELEVQAACGAVTTKNFNCTEFSIDLAATAQTYSAPDYEDEEVRCKRYYRVFVGNGTAALGGLSARGNMPGAANAIQAHIPLGVSMRAAPTATKVGTWTVSNCAQPSVTADTEILYLYSNSSGAGDTYFYATTSEGVTLSAEL